VIGMKVTETHEVQIAKVRMSFSETEKTAATGIDHDASFSVDPNQVRGGGARIVGYRAT
jgi:hypothetical protein